MKRGLSLLTATILTVLMICAGANHTVNAQTQCTAPVDFHRFIVNWYTLGTFLTANYNEGAARGYAYYPFPGPMKIALPPGAGWTPVPGQGLQPLYRYRIVQGSRTYYGYFNGLAYGSGYYYEGIAGYTLPGYGQYGGVPLHAWYSQSKGYFYTQGFYEQPYGGVGNGSFSDHYYPAYMPDGASYCWNPPPPACSNPGAEEECYINGGVWNTSNCTCSYIPPDPCRQSGGDLGADKDLKGKDTVSNQLAPIPCRPQPY